MVPTNKHDLEAVKALQSASDDQVINNAEELLEWLQDANWPVFNGVVNRLSRLGDRLLVPINRILNGDDSVWKANIVGHLIPSFSLENQQLYVKSLESVLAEYKDNDLREGVIDFIEMQLANDRENT